MNSVLIFVYKENKNIFVFADICIKLWKNTKKKVGKSGFFEGRVCPGHMENRAHARLCYALSNY